MARHYRYACTRCGKDCPRELLTVKNVRFLEIGERPKQLRSRNTDWLCPDCVVKDEDWNRESNSSSPEFLGEPSSRRPQPLRPPALRQQTFEEPDLDSALAIGSEWQAPAEV